jgi:hypothetical protein
MAATPSTITADLRSEVLAPFDHQTRDALNEFMKHLYGLDVDAVMFMARKSYCVYDVLTRVGYVGPDCAILTDRTLDFRLDHLSGKRVALVDDTVILGSTLARARATLADAGASVSVHALCVNRDYYSKDVVELDYVQMLASDAFVETLCAAEISCLATLPRPYIVDFPVSASIAVPTSGLGHLRWTTDWLTFPVETATRSAVLSYSFFPPAATVAEFRSALGTGIADCVDIAKVRVFGRIVEKTAWFTVVPIVTLKPLRFQDARGLAEHLMDRIAHDEPSLPALVGSAVQKASGWLRISQHLLSAALGQRFLSAVSTSVPAMANPLFVDRDATVHFGPSLGERLREIAPSVERAFFHPTSGAMLPTHIEPAALPASVHRRTEALFGDGDLLDGSIRLDRSQPPSGSLETDFAEIFLALHERYELRARREMKALGADAFRATPDKAPFRDRLILGVPWPSMTEYLAARYRTENTEAFQRLLSLVLDRLNDLGISVPITCEEMDVVYRAYRHGEDVPIDDSHLNLAYDLVEGILTQSGKPTVDAITLEKMLALLIDLGISQRYILPKRDLPSGSPERGMLHKAYALFGVVMQYRERPTSATSSDTWFSRYLVKRRVLARDGSGKYSLGSRVDGSQIHHRAAAFAYGLGDIVGTLLRLRAFQTDHLVALATTRDARATLAAIEIEAVLFAEWWREQRGRVLGSLAAAPAVQSRMAQRIANGVGYRAVNSAIKKAHWYRTAWWRTSIDEAAAALRAGRREKDAREWESYWRPYLDAQVVPGREALETKVSELTALCWEMAAWTTLLIAGLGRADAARLGGGARQQQKFATWRSLMGDISVHPPTGLARVEPMLAQIQTATAAAAICREAAEELTRLSHRVDDEVMLVDSMLASFDEPFVGRSYSHVLWYDLVDSRGNRMADGQDVESYRRQSFAVRELINERLRLLQRKVEQANGDLHVWKDDLRSDNDEKHIAASGNWAADWIVEALTTIVQCVTAHPGTRLRAIVTGADFVDSRLERAFDGEMSGTSFLEHFADLQRQIKGLEHSDDGPPCLLMLVGRKALNLRPNLELQRAVDVEVRTEVAGGRRTSRAVYGWL